MTDIRILPHNRSSIAKRNNSHFLYKADRRPLALQDIISVGSAVRDIVRADMRLMAAEIELFSMGQFRARSNQALKASLGRLLKGLGLEAQEHRLSFVFCDWAAPHEDSPSAGCAFVSTVLHTGPYPYWMSMFHSRETPAHEFELHTSTRILRQGDTFVFDPTIPHMSAPVRPHQDQFLVLLQAELEIRTEEQVAQLIAQFPRAASDCDTAFIGADEETARTVQA